MPHVQCPACNRGLNVPESAVGKSGSCPACKHRFVIPDDSGREPPPVRRVDREPAERPSVRTRRPDPPRSRGKKRKKSKSRSLARIGLIVAAAVVGIGLMGGVVAGGWLLLGGSEDESSPTREPKASLKPGNLSTLYPEEFPPADPATWKVSVEAADPAPPRLRTSIACPASTTGSPILALAFADPRAATAAVVLGQKERGKGLPWWQVSLVEPGQITVVNLIDPDPNRNLAQAAGEVALSPSGDLLATGFNSGYVGKPTGVVIWGRDGRKQREWAEGSMVNDQPTVRGMWFTSADRLLVWANDALVCREVSTGREVYRRPLKVVGDAVLTPRRTWLLAGVEGGVEAIAAADGSTAGRLTIPGFRPEGGMRLAVSPDGNRLAALPFCETGIPIVVWTLADGKPVFARYREAESKWLAGTGRPRHMPALHWVGDRHIVMGGNAVFDLDLGGVSYLLSGQVGADAASGPTPDARVWRLLTVLDAKDGRFPAAGNFVAATAVPPLPDGGVVVGPKTSFRVAVEGASGHTGAVREALADAVAERGYAVDPAAELTILFQGKNAKTSSVPAKEVLNPKWDQRPPPGYRLLAPVDMHEVSYHLSIRDREGRVLWKSENRLCQALDFDEKGRVLGWQQAAHQAARDLPGRVRLIPNQPPVNFPLHGVPRADGTAEVSSVP